MSDPCDKLVVYAQAVDNLGMLQRRSLRFTDFDQVLADAEHLMTTGYDRAGNWNLAQVCHHLAVVFENSMDGFPKLLPWPVRLIARQFFLPQVLRHETSHRRAPAAADLLPPDTEDAAAAIDRLRRSVGRFNAHRGDLARSPAFGTLTPSKWREVHLWHCEHHLSFLIPKQGSATLGHE